MKKLIASLLLVAAIPLVGVLSGPVAAARTGESIIVNGSFEKPSHGGTYFDGQRFGHWLVTRSSVDQVRKVWQAAEGVQCIDLSGYDAGAISQRPDATIGQTYTLRFALAGNTEGGPMTMRMLVRWQGTLVADLTFDTTGHSSQNMGWTSYSFQVTATVANPALKFISKNRGVHGPALDDVSLVPVVS